MPPYKDPFDLQDLPKKAARELPVMLDFIYGKRLAITFENATALSTLAQFFDSHALKAKVVRFLEDQPLVEPDDLEMICRDAKTLGGAVVMDIVIQKCARDIKDIVEGAKSALLKVFDVESWRVSSERSVFRPRTRFAWFWSCAPSMRNP